MQAALLHIVDAIVKKIPQHTESDEQFTDSIVHNVSIHFGAMTPKEHIDFITLYGSTKLTINSPINKLYRAAVDLAYDDLQVKRVGRGFSVLKGSPLRSIAVTNATKEVTTVAKKTQTETQTEAEAEAPKKPPAAKKKVAAKKKAAAKPAAKKEATTKPAAVGAKRARLEGRYAPLDASATTIWAALDKGRDSALKVGDVPVREGTHAHTMWQIVKGAGRKKITGTIAVENAVAQGYTHGTANRYVAYCVNTGMLRVV